MCTILRRFSKNSIEPLKPQEFTRPVSKEQYTAQKLSEVDKTLNLDTYRYEVAENERKINSRFIEIKGQKEDRVEQATLFRRLVGKLKERQAYLLPLIRNRDLEMAKAKIICKPDIEKIKISEFKKSYYDYLLNPNPTDPQIQNFLTKEKNYANSHFACLGQKSNRITNRWLQEYISFYSSYPCFYDNNCYEVKWDPSLTLTKRPFHNIKNLLDFDKTQPEVVFGFNEMTEYLLGFKDDFSYFVCRLLKNKKLTKEMLETVTISGDERYLAISFLLEGKYLTIIKDIKENTFLKYYFNSKLDFLSFYSENGTDYDIVFKLEGSIEVKSLKLRGDQFEKVREVNGIIESVTRYMISNKSKLVMNTIRDVIHHSDLLLELDMTEKCDTLVFGRNVLLRSPNHDESTFDLNLLRDGRFLHIGVF